jgi:serine/threonine protein phosphatase PrpC
LDRLKEDWMKQNQARRRSPPETEGPTTATEAGAAAEPALDAAQLTDVGRSRPHNEDHVGHVVPTDPQQRRSKGSLFLVADGMGGHQAGEVASGRAVEMVMQQYYADTEHDVASSLVRAFRAANRAIHEQAQSDPSRSGMGTTLVAAVVLGPKVYVANVGDSRAYIVNNEGINQITVDHSWVEEQIKAGLLTAEQARTHPQRNLVTRALGSRPSVEVDLFEGQMEPDDVLLLCSDGLTGHVEDWELEATVRQHPPQEAARHLIDTANKRGGGDNISVVIVAARRKAAPAPAPAVPAKPAKRSPVLPIVAAVAGVLVLVGVGLLVVPSLLGPSATPTPSPSPEATTVADTPTATVPATESAAPAAVPTLAGTTLVTEAISPTATLMATWTPTSTPAPTETATATATPTATHTPSPQATATESAANTPVPPGRQILTLVPTLSPLQTFTPMPSLTLP